jgi:hypothetical protein
MMITKKQKRSTTQKTSRCFDTVVGADIYAVWVRMLQELVPHGRTHRLSVMLASMLQYAASMAASDRKDAEDDSSLTSSLIQATEVGDPSEVEELLHDAVVQLFKDAKVPFARTSARGTKYSIADEAYAEFIHWYDMPWE